MLSGDEGVLVPLADEGEVDVVGVRGRGSARRTAVAGSRLPVSTLWMVSAVDALRGVDGGGVAELDVLGDIVGGQGDDPVGAGVW